MRIVLFFLFMFLGVNPVYAVSKLGDKGAVVRNFIWGVSPQDVQSFEVGKVLKYEGDNLFYSDTIYGKESTIGYQFLSGQLNRVRIDIHQHLPNPQDWIVLLMDVQKDLTARWGAPFSEEFIWHDDEEKAFPPNWGLAVMKGEMEASMRWVGNDTFVEVSLEARGKMRPILTIDYQYKAPKNRKRNDAQSAPVVNGVNDPLLMP